MNNKEISDLIHDELIPCQQVFKSYEQLAGNGFRFNTKEFRKCIACIQRVIDTARELVKEEAK